MGRARGADAEMHLAFESSYGSPPASGYKQLPFVSSSIGANRGLLESDLLGQGRAPFDPTPDVTNNDGDVVVGVDIEKIGLWLQLLLGPAVTSGTTNKTHLFKSGLPTLPSASIQIAHPRVPSFSINYGVRANTLRMSTRRAGLLNATIGLIGKGETTPASTSSVAAPTAAGTIKRFPQGSGYVLKDGVAIGSIVEADFAFTNNLDKIETVQPDGEIEDVDPGMPAASGKIRVRFANHDLLNLATAGTPIALGYGWTSSPAALGIDFPRVLLPRAKREITGPGGIMADFDWQASSAGGVVMSATLLNTVAGYA